MTRWSLGVLIGGPIAALIALVLLGFLVWAIMGGRRYGWTDGGYKPMWSGWRYVVTYIPVVLAIEAIIVAGAYWPYQAEYHQWQRVSGVVAEKSSRLLGSGSDTVTQRFVVTLDGVGERSCDDTRCALVKEGDVLTLDCKRHWQYSGVDGWDCNYVSNEEEES